MPEAALRAMRHTETHRIEHLGWLRAAVLGANDGIISTASLLVGIAAAHASHSNMLLTGFAGLVAGSMSMATGEYVSVSSQADTEHAALKQEKAELAHDPDAEHRELVGIYVQRGLDRSLAQEVATQLMSHDAIGTHARDELGISEATLLGLAGLGALAAKTGGAPALPAALRVTCWSALAMGSTVAIGSAFNVGV
jgi:VIT1/CCC1 family predicted Fe2+/Mn2+ transporter